MRSDGKCGICADRANCNEERTRWCAQLRATDQDDWCGWEEQYDNDKEKQNEVL